MKEYEYSFKVDSLKPYIDYCINNNYDFIEETKECRTIYRNSNKTIARITIKNGMFKSLDFKDDIISDEVLIERRESKSVVFEDIEAVESILDFLNYKKDNTLIRTRVVYKKENVKFELDNYESPEPSFVVAIEGNKEVVDKVYEDVKCLN